MYACTRYARRGGYTIYIDHVSEHDAQFTDKSFAMSQLMFKF